MKLIVKDFAKIKKAELIFNGLTVIAGDNNTGKSTIGKILFTLFHRLRNMPQRVFDERKASIAAYLVNSQLSREDNEKSPLPFIRKVFHITEDLDDGDSAPALWYREITKKIQTDLQQDLDDDEAKKLKDRIEAIWSHSEEEIEKEIVKRAFSDVFADQIKPLKEQVETEINLEVQHKEKAIRFMDNECVSYQSSINLIEDAIYVDDPFIIDECFKKQGRTVSETRSALKKYLAADNRPSAVDTIEIREKLTDINRLLERTIPGNILHKENRLVLELADKSGALNVENWSAGIKSFAILKRLLENNSLKERGVLILDEPEIHLHPQWQLIYAEVIVLLQKAFNLTVLLTTHSPFFLDALEVFAHKHNIDDQTNYYLSKNTNEGIEFLDVTDNIDLIYEKMSNPVQDLETIRAELQMGR